MAKNKLSITVDTDIFLFIRSQHENVSVYFNDLARTDIESRYTLDAINKKIEYKEDQTKMIENELKILHKRKKEITQQEFKNNQQKITREQEEEERKYQRELTLVKSEKDLFDKLKSIKKNKPILQELNTQLVNLKCEYDMRYINFGVSVLTRFINE